MGGILTVIFVLAALHFAMNMGRKEVCDELYEDCINDVEARLEWAKTRELQPPGMKTQMDNARELLDEAKALWEAPWLYDFEWDKNKSKWFRAMRIAVQARKAMNEAQNIFIRGYDASKATEGPWYVSEKPAEA